ncbi:MAG: hypothetical protein VYC97_11830, partial [SAR324 cluster bacterium]|nr:hypothetical protein [SAR324 cluster bacterium]
MSESQVAGSSPPALDQEFQGGEISGGEDFGPGALHHFRMLAPEWKPLEAERYWYTLQRRTKESTTYSTIESSIRNN